MYGIHGLWVSKYVCNTTDELQSLKLLDGSKKKTLNHRNTEVNKNNRNTNTTDIPILNVGKIKIPPT